MKPMATKRRRTRAWEWTVGLTMLFGLALKKGGVLVTLDAAVRHLAGTEFKSHLLIPD